jgi:hyperosmotically inducible periplasmic protein
MRTTNLMKTMLVAFAIGAALPACSAIEGRQSAGQYVDDASIATKVRTAIVGDPDLKLRQIDVNVMDKVVQLSGFVDSAAQKARAADVAKRVDGVRSVKNDIVVR